VGEDVGADVGLLGADVGADVGLLGADVGLLGADVGADVGLLGADVLLNLNVQSVAAPMGRMIRSANITIAINAHMTGYFFQSGCILFDFLDIYILYIY